MLSNYLICVEVKIGQTGFCLIDISILLKYIYLKVHHSLDGPDIWRFETFLLYIYLRLDIRPIAYMYDVYP